MNALLLRRAAALTLLCAVAAATGALPTAASAASASPHPRHHAPKHHAKPGRHHRAKKRHVARHAAASTSALYVDAASLGGRCSDARAASAVTVASPWCTLARAAAVAPAGARVLVRQAAYPRLTLTDSHPAAAVSYEAYPGERPSLPGIAATRSSGFRFTGFLFTGESDLASVANFAFTRIEAVPPFAGPGTDSGFVVTGARSGLWDGVTVHDAWNGVQFRWGGAQDIDIRNCTFRALGNDGVDLEAAARVRVTHNDFISVHARADMQPAAHSDAVQLLGPGDDVRLEGNAIRDGRGFMLQFSPTNQRIAGGALTHVVVDDNVFTGPDFAVRAFSTPGLQIVNNTVWGPRVGAGTGIDLRGGVLANAPTTGVVLVNNIIRQLGADPSVTFGAADHNLVIAGPTAGAAASAASIARAPLFANALALDLHLLAGSAGVDAGTTAYAPATDRDGRLRAGAPDLGAYELGGVLAPVAVPDATAGAVPATGAPATPVAAPAKPATPVQRSAASKKAKARARKTRLARKSRQARKLRRARAKRRHARRHARR